MTDTFHSIANIYLNYLINILAPRSTTLSTKVPKFFYATNPKGVLACACAIRD